MFEFSGSWQKDAAHTKTLAFDGVLITLYTFALEKSHMLLCDRVKKAVPSSWDPPALARSVGLLPSQVNCYYPLMLVGNPSLIAHI